MLTVDYATVWVTQFKLSSYIKWNNIQLNTSCKNKKILTKDLFYLYKLAERY